MDAINCDVDPSALVEGLRQHPNARLLMNGPPGSGKSFFARQIAEALGMTVMVQRASDLITAFVGETEQNIAAAFRAAQSEGSMLIVDEADTFLNSRSASSKRYEVSMVNEMLTQLEDFQGLCAFTTNFKDKLDEAVMRRFDLKITFHRSDPEHVLVMLEETCRALGIPHGDLTGFASTLPNVTPGDFATVVRQSRFNPLTTVEEVLKRLRQESSHKTVNRATTIGFMRAA
jgi:SpoVK/Ycf46/Vps4 family AAA+-type ATPase